MSPGACCVCGSEIYPPPEWHLAQGLEVADRQPRNPVYALGYLEGSAEHALLALMGICSSECGRTVVRALAVLLGAQRLAARFA